MTTRLNYRGNDVSRQHRRVNRFGFAEYDDMIGLSRSVNTAELTGDLRAIVALVLSEDTDFIDSLSDSAQADFVVPLGMSAGMLSQGDYSVVELLSAACTVQYCAEPHMAEFSDELVHLLSQLPR
ncbi:hypothetical protein ACIOMM_29265 [Streptomyces sp. NPDC087908]|uniref:hypothetical protein n=1 Tax=Streptomyces sp. NPDC087908 TaxID=3365820 RepID=UPI003810EDD5